MNKLKNLFLIGTFSLFSYLGYSQDYFLNNEGKPSRKGIEYYLKNEFQNIKQDFKKTFKVELDSTDIYLDSLAAPNGKNLLNELGNYVDGIIAIDENENFFAYSNNNLPKSLEGKIIECDAFLRGTIIHELAHQFIDEFKYYSISDNELVVSLNRKKENFVETFVEEGVAQYCAKKMNEIIYSKKPKIPKTKEELLTKDKEKEYEIKYKYSLYFIEPIFKKHSFEEGVKLLLEEPPTIEEILDRNLYYEHVLNNNL